MQILNFSITRIKIKLIVLYFLYSNIALNFGCEKQSNLKFLITNAGDNKLDSMKVFVTGNSYYIGSLYPSTTSSISISPSSDSHIEVEATSVEKGKRRTVVGCYFGPGYSGFIHINIKIDSIVSIIDSTRI